MNSMTDTNTWQDQLRRTAEGYRETLAEIWETIDGTRTVECEDCEGSGLEDGSDCPTCSGDGEIVATEVEGQDPREYLDEMPLEIVWEPGEPFAVVLGTGGPHVEIAGGGRQGGYRLTVYWSGEYTVSGEAITRAGEYFREMVEESSS